MKSSYDKNFGHYRRRSTWNDAYKAAKKMPEEISKVIVLDPNENCSASLVGLNK